MRFSSIALYAGLLVTASSHSVEGTLKLPELTKEESYGTYLELTDLATYKHTRSYITENGTFSFDNLGEGKYLVDVVALNYVFEYNSAVVDISKEVIQQEDGSSREAVVTSAYEYQFGHALLDTPNEINYPLVFFLKAKDGKKTYYEVKDRGLANSGPLGTILGNPLLLAGGVFILAMMGVPYLLEKLDPETAKLMKGETEEKEVTAKEILENKSKITTSGSAKHSTKAKRRT